MKKMFVNISLLFFLVPLAGCMPASGVNPEAVATNLAPGTQTSIITSTSAPVLASSNITGQVIYSKYIDNQ